MPSEYISLIQNKTYFKIQDISNLDLNIIFHHSSIAVTPPFHLSRLHRHFIYGGYTAIANLLLEEITVKFIVLCGQYYIWRGGFPDRLDLIQTTLCPMKGYTVMSGHCLARCRFLSRQLFNRRRVLSATALSGEAIHPEKYFGR